MVNEKLGMVVTKLVIIQRSFTATQSECNINKSPPLIMHFLQ